MRSERTRVFSAASTASITKLQLLPQHEGPIFDPRLRIGRHGEPMGAGAEVVTAYSYGWNLTVFTSIGG